MRQRRRAGCRGASATPPGLAPLGVAPLGWALLRWALLGLALLALPPDAAADPPSRLVANHGAADHVAPSAATTAATVVLRGGEHPGFTRLVFHLPAGATARLQPLANGLVVWVPGAIVAAPRRLAGASVTVAGERATLSWPPGTQWRQMHLPGRLVIDLLHAAASQPAAEAAPSAPKPLPATARRPAAPPPAALPVGKQAGVSAPPASLAPASIMPAPAPSAAVAAAAAPVAAPTAPVVAMPLAPAPQANATAPAPVAPAPAAPSPAAAPPAAMAAMPPDPAMGDAVLLHFPAGTGAAAFRRGPWAIAVFDDAHPTGLAALRQQPALAAAEVRTLAAATELRLRLGPDQALALAQRRGGWTVAVVSGVPPMRAIHPATAAGHLELPMDRAGRVVSVPDPDTGGLLLVGTQGPLASFALRAATLAAAVPGAPPIAQGVPVERRTPLLALLATWQGVAVEPGADDLVLRPTQTGFSTAGFLVEHTASGEALSLAAADSADRVDAAAAFGRLFDLPNASLTALSRRLEAATGMAAALPVQDRGPARLRAAQAMLALGLGAEAEALVRLAEADDARLVDDPQAEAVAAAGALLAGRTAEAGALTSPALTAPGAAGADEAMLWRALLAARRADAAQQADPAAAQLLAAKLPLLLAYPAPLRDRLLPDAVRAMAQGGEARAAQRAVDARADDHRLDYVRAMLAEQASNLPRALALTDRLAIGRDPDLAARAAVRAVEIRLKSHALTPLQAADALDPLIYAWRGDGRELAVRLREAALRMQAGQSRQALAVLREAADPVLSQGWPDQRPAIAARLRDSFAEAVSRDAGEPMAPLDFVTMVEENADLLPPGTAGQALAERVADKLAALDLPDQAAAALARLIDKAPPGGARGALGARLAALQIDQHDAPSALMTLSATTGDGLPPDLVATRTLLFARATAARGNLAAATGALEALGTPAADDLAAKLFAGAGKWPQADVALQRLARRTLPPSGMLDSAQADLLLRLASAAAQAGDSDTLAGLRDTELARVPPGRAADLLRVLTEGPVQTVADLPRSGAEMALARSALK